MKSVLVSIQPKWCELIVSGKKTIEVRKTVPKLETSFKCYIYCTTKEFDVTIFDYLGLDSVRTVKDGQGMIIGEFVCDRIDEFYEWQLSPQGKFQEAEQIDLDNFLKASCLTWEEVCAYRSNLPYYKPLYGWHISDLKIYDKPKELKDIATRCTVKSCIGCEYYDLGDYYNPPECRVEGVKPIKRPPQSWCYVEGQ